MNEKPVSIDKRHPQSTIDMTGKHILDAYRFLYKGKIIYNTYNLLRGDDDWDPMEIKPIVAAAEKESKKSLTNLPTQLLISPTHDTIESGRESVVLKTRLNKFGNYELKGEPISWKVADKYKSLVKLNIKDDGTCEVVPTNDNDETKEVIVEATNSSGLQAACRLRRATSASSYCCNRRIVQSRASKSITLSGRASTAVMRSTGSVAAAIKRA